MANHVMFRADNMAGTLEGKYLASVRVGEADIDNGLIVGLGDYEAGEREVRKMVPVAKQTPLGSLAILGSVEVDKTTNKPVSGFTNKAGSVARGYILEHGDYFADTEGAFSEKPTVGKVIEVQAGSNQFKVVSVATPETTVIGKCVAIEVDGATTWYVVRVD